LKLFQQIYFAINSNVMTHCGHSNQSSIVCPKIEELYYSFFASLCYIITKY